MRRPIPLAYAGLLIVALVAVVGFAAYSPNSVGTGEGTSESLAAPTTPVSARVASAVLALRVSNINTRLTETPSTSTPQASPSSVGIEESDDAAPQADSTTTTATPSTTTTATPSTTVAVAPSDTTPPHLHITSPSDGATVNDRVVTFEGTSEPGAEVFSGPYAASIDEDGDWSIKLVVSSEGSKANITARDQAGNSVTKSITVTYKASAPPPPPPPPPPSPPTTSGGTTWSPLWPADAAGNRNVEQWRPLVEQYWPGYLVNCALNIIHLESWGNPQAYNSSSSAEGLFQHLSKYWKARAAGAGFRDANGLYATPYNAEANIAAAWLIAKNSSPWDRPWTVNPQHPNAPNECTE